MNRRRRRGQEPAKAHAPRVFVGPTEIAGYYAGLVTGLRAIGIEADLVTALPHTFKYTDSLEPRGYLYRARRSAARKYLSVSGNRRVAKLTCAALHRVLTGLFLLQSVLRYDVFVYGFGNSITNRDFELRIQRLVGNKILFSLVGSDARPSYIDVGIYDMPDDDGISTMRDAALSKRRRILKMERYAHAVISYGPYGQLHSRPFVDQLIIGFPRQVQRCEAPVPERGGGSGHKTRILHSPSDPVAKGSSAIAHAMIRLKQKGHDIDYVEIHGVSNATVLEELATCDFVVDQLYSDTPLAGFAVEAAWFAKPAVVGGYFAQEIEGEYRSDHIPPSLFVHPDRIEEAIEKLILDTEFRRRLGRRAQEFVLTRWAPGSVARRYMRVIDGNVPSEWLRDPMTIRYVRGAGVPENRTRRVVRDLIQTFGAEALQVHHNPALEAEFVRFAHQEVGPAPLTGLPPFP